MQQQVQVRIEHILYSEAQGGVSVVSFGTCLELWLLLAVSAFGLHTCRLYDDLQRIEVIEEVSFRTHDTKWSVCLRCLKASYPFASQL